MTTVEPSDPQAAMLKLLAEAGEVLGLTEPAISPVRAWPRPMDDDLGPWSDEEEEKVMRLFVAGPSGAIGSRLVPQLIDAGHEVIGTHTTPDSGRRVVALGATPVALDLLDARAVQEAVLAARPDAIVHVSPALSSLSDFKHFDRSFAQTNRLRTEGTDALLRAPREAAVRRIVAQSYAGARYARDGGPVKSEDDSPDPRPVSAMRETIAAVHHLNEAVAGARGIALRYGTFYGASNDGLVEPVRIPIVDDEAAPVREWLPVLAGALGAKPPRHVPVWLVRLLAGEPGVVMGTEARGASNAKGRRESGWMPRYPSWRTGFFDAYASRGAKVIAA